MKCPLKTAASFEEGRALRAASNPATVRRSAYSLVTRPASVGRHVVLQGNPLPASQNQVAGSSLDSIASTADQLNSEASRCRNKSLEPSARIRIALADTWNLTAIGR